MKGKIDKSRIVARNRIASKRGFTVMDINVFISFFIVCMLTQKDQVFKLLKVSDLVEAAKHPPLLKILPLKWSNSL